MIYLGILSHWIKNFSLDWFISSSIFKLNVHEQLGRIDSS